MDDNQVKGILNMEKSLRSSSLNQSKISAGNSLTEASPSDFGSKRVSHGSTGGDSGAIYTSKVEISLNSASKKSACSYHSNASIGNSIREVTFGDLGSNRGRYGSRGGDSEAFSISQKDINDEEARLVYMNDPRRTNERYVFAGNSIYTGKYSVLSFLPRNLFEQFHRVAYIYFLIIIIFNQVPQLAVFGREASILPLAFVLVVTAVKDAYEDWRRHKSDRIENNRLSWTVIDNEFKQKKWKEIQAGDVIKIYENETLPCDIVLLSTSDPTGVMYVQTINLDGESNLKTRYAKQETLKKSLGEEITGGLVKCEKPNRNIYGFHAVMDLDGKRLSLGPSNIVLRGCELKNTAWMVGVAVYCGSDTKVMLNSSGAPSKRSRLEEKMNSEIVMLSLFLAVFCTVVSVCAAVWLRRHRDQLDVMPFYRKKDFGQEEEEDYNYYGWGLEILFTFLMSIIVFQVLIPISLYISMELVRVGQAYFMIRDRKMFDGSSNSRFQCRALNINEDLGQIKYVFSDKTGTLTENKMEFRCTSILGVDYNVVTNADSHPDHGGWLSEVDGKVLKPKVKVNVHSQLLEFSRSGTDRAAEVEHVHDFFLALAACNTIVPLAIDAPDSNVKLMDYQGESPDEQALAYAAAAYGFMLVERTSGHIVVDVLGERQRYHVLGIHEFDSDRKRMSVILKCPDGNVKVYVKGADTSMFSIIDRCSSPSIIQATEAHVRTYASQGLRTLVVGIRKLSNSEFEQWQFSFEAASTALMGRAGLLRKVAGNVEKNLRILGASAIEDKLQNGVPEAIESLRIAGIKVWVLTGDKQETAVSVGYSSRLITRKMTQFIIRSNSEESCRSSLESALTLMKKLCDTSVSVDSVTPTALIIDGTSLVYILDTELEEQLFQLARRCSVVLCCRVAPLQKAGIVALVKNRTRDMTLSVGDGANDVAMIQMADVGVGISGQEGRQAVMASDFAMGQFRFLVPLLLVHGHWNYQRMGHMILYNFYRNAVFVLLLFWYVLFTGFSLTTAINEWSSMLYSIIYTSLPTIVVGVLDRDVSRKTLLRHPQLYGAGHKGECYNKRLFWLTMADTMWQSLVIFFVPLGAYWATAIDASSLGDLWTLAVVTLVNLHLAMDVVRWTWVTHAAIWGSILATFICIIIIDSFPTLVGFWAIFDVARTRLFWLCLLAVVVAALVPRMVVKTLGQHYRPCDTQIARESERAGNPGGELEAAFPHVEMNQNLLHRR